MMEIRFPNITAQDEAGQLRQVRNYLYQMVEQLNWTLKTIESGSTGKVVDARDKAISKAEVKSDPVSNFNNIKALIIKSADIVNAYYEEINSRLEGLYVAESDFGTYKEKTSNEIQQTSTSVSSLYTNIQEILDSIDAINNRLYEVNVRINYGLLDTDDDGVPIYGFEVGQRTTIDGVEVFNKYARFTADRLSFYDQNDIEVAYVSDQKLYITHVEITGSFLMGGFVDTVLSDGSVVTKWKGG